MRGKDYFLILGIGQNASDDDIKKAYRKMALKYHPDKNKETNAEEKFKEIAEAYGIFSNDYHAFFRRYGARGAGGDFRAENSAQNQQNCANGTTTSCRGGHQQQRGRPKIWRPSPKEKKEYGAGGGGQKTTTSKDNSTGYGEMNTETKQKTTTSKDNSSGDGQKNTTSKENLAGYGQKNTETKQKPTTSKDNLTGDGQKTTSKENLAGYGQKNTENKQKTMTWKDNSLTGDGQKTTSKDNWAGDGQKNTENGQKAKTDGTGADNSATSQQQNKPNKQKANGPTTKEKENLAPKRQGTAKGATNAHSTQPTKLLLVSGIEGANVGGEFQPLSRIQLIELFLIKVAPPVNVIDADTRWYGDEFFGFVELGSPEESKRALGQLDNIVYKGRNIKVKYLNGWTRF
ncbi:DnaJ sub B member 4 [Globodera pallida]|nr:DnaJ sub B member 4 [Globodera pallida]